MAIIGAAGLTIGLALHGALSNFLISTDLPLHPEKSSLSRMRESRTLSKTSDTRIREHDGDKVHNQSGRSVLIRSNFSARVFMIIFRPFKSGNYIEGGVSGVVSQIQIFTSELPTPDNKLEIVQNANMMSSNITKHSANSTRHVDLVTGVSHSDDLSKVKQVLQTIIDEIHVSPNHHRPP